ncbi:MAG: MBL fold metallo-hydrolase [Halioglobus sp.]
MRVFATVVFVVSFVLNATVVADEKKVRITELRGSLHLLQGKGGNVVASVGADGILLVDDDYEPLAGDYQQALNTLSGATDTPSYVLNTHWHADHTGTNTHWAQSGAVIVAQTNVRQRMSRPSKSPVTGKNRPARPISALPVISYANSMSLYFNADDVELEHFPSGHTDGDSVVFFSAQNVVHMGDLFFNGAFPFVDTSSGGSLDGYILNVERALQRVDGDTLVVPGHGPLANKSDLERYLAMIRATQNEVLKAISSGKSAQEILKQGLSPQWESWGTGFIKEHQWIATLLAANS